MEKAKLKMQEVKFLHVEEFLDYLPDDELKLVQFLRQIIFDCIPNVEERMSFSVPFYKRNKGICFIWPSAVLWGKKKSYDGVRFGFNTGYLISDEMGYLDKGNRKQVYYKDFKSISEIDVPLLKTYIFEALEIDNTFTKSKK